MKTVDAIKHFGSKTKIAEALGITRGAVSQWGEHVPEAQAMKLERLTDGALTAEADYPKRVPGLPATTAAVLG